MPEQIKLFGHTFEDNIYIPIASVLFLIAWMVIGVTLKAIVFSYVKRWTARTETRIDDLVIDALNFPATLLIFASGLMILVRLGVSTEYITHQQLYNALLIVGILSIVLFADRALRGAITTYSDRIEVFRMAGGLVQSCVRGIVLITGMLVLLGTLGINITPLIASLGVGSLAVALALQPTLENFFAGVQVISDRQIMEGQYIRLESGEEGFVHKINMRTTWMRTAQGNMLVFPNKLLVMTRIMNYDYPTPQFVLSVPLNARYESDMDKIERVTLDVARQVQKDAEFAVRDHDPAFRIVNLAESYISFTVSLKIDDVNNSGAVRHEFLKRLLKRYREEKIETPYPVRTMVSTEVPAQPKAA